MSWDLFSAAEAAARDAEARAPRRPMEWSVSRLNAAAREVIETGLPPVWVVGEVSNFTRARSGHCYFSLRDESAQIRCVMWRDDARRLPTEPTEGMEVRVFGRLTLYEARGEFQLVVTALEGKGEGLWKLAIERLKRKLDAEGLTDPARRRPIPRFPRAVGVVTSPTGAVLQDIRTVVRRRSPWTPVILCGCRVQGEGAAEEIVRAIRLFGQARCADVLIVGRGGGSIEDLWAFNEESVVRAIAESPIPTISAIGHETDVTLSDLVADLRAPTPSAAAEAAVPDAAALARDLHQTRARLTASAGVRIQRARQRLEILDRSLDDCMDDAVRTGRDRLRSAAQHLNALSPLAALERGYAVPLDEEGRLLRSAEQFGPPGRRFALRVRDGVVRCAVEGINQPLEEA